MSIHTFETASDVSAAVAALGIENRLKAVATQLESGSYALEVPDELDAILDGLDWEAAHSSALEQIRAAMPTLSPRQFWLAASRIDITKEAVLALVDAMDDKQAASDMRIEITETVSFQRTNEAVDQLATLLGITPEQLDSLWIWAAQF